MPIPAIGDRQVNVALSSISASYPTVGTLALGIGRGNVLAMPPSSIHDIAKFGRIAKTHFPESNVLLEVSTSLVGKIEPQIARAIEILTACEKDGTDCRFVIVGNTALSSEKYWDNLDHFLRSMEEFRGQGDGTGDILQLALSAAHLPEPKSLIEILKDYRFPVNFSWAPFHDQAADDEGLEKLSEWIAEMWSLTREFGLDSSLVNRISKAIDNLPAGLPALVEHAEVSSNAVLYIAADGNWHRGMFTVLAEMDPVRFDPGAGFDENGRLAVATDHGRDIKNLMRNKACRACPHLALCITTGAHRLGLMTLRRQTAGTTSCPSAMRGAFDRATAQLLETAQ